MDYDRKIEQDLNLDVLLVCLPIDDFYKLFKEIETTKQEVLFTSVVDRLGQGNFVLYDVFDHIDQDFFHILENLDYNDSIGNSSSELAVVVGF